MQTENAWALYRYQQHMKEAKGLDAKTIDARLRHVHHFDAVLQGKLFRNITRNDISRYKSGLIATDGTGAQTGEKRLLQRLFRCAET